MVVHFMLQQGKGKGAAMRLGFHHLSQLEIVTLW